jgi:hypothetical protein
LPAADTLVGYCAAQVFQPNAAGQVSKQQVQQQQLEAGLVADVDRIDIMMQLAKQLAAEAAGLHSSDGGARSAQLLEFEEFVALAQHL